MRRLRIVAAMTASRPQNFVFNYVVTDGDGDTASGSLTIRVNDDVAVTTGAVTSPTILDDEAQGLFPANTGFDPDGRRVSGCADCDECGRDLCSVRVRTASPRSG